MTIRTRLLLLVLGVWLPAAVGFGLLARETYLNEQEQARHAIVDIARDVASRVELELDRRAAPVHALALSSSVGGDRLDAPGRDMAPAGDGAQGRLGLIDSEGRWLDGSSPGARLGDVASPVSSPLPALPPLGTAAFLVRETGDGAPPMVAIFSAAPPESGGPRHAALVFPPDVIQQVVATTEGPSATLIVVLDSRQRIAARNLDPERWIGAEPTADIRDRIRGGRPGFASAVTLEGRHMLSYLGRPSRYGWHVAIGFPHDTFAAAARRLTLQAVAASALLLLIGLGIALYHARVIGSAVHSLRRAAARLGADEVPPPLDTGLHEADMVGATLHEAGLRSQEATRLLERRVAEAVRETEEAQSRLLEARKHEVIGRLTGGLAHDFNNLLQTISSALELLSQGTRSPTQARIVEAALRACGKAADLVRQMLAFGRVQPLRREPVDLGDFLLNSQHLVAKAVGEKIRLAVRLAPGLPPVVVDPTQLELAVLNLLFNARDALAGARSVANIVIAARSATAADTDGLCDGRYVCLEVSDDGPGMDEATRARAFDPYYTTKPKGAGSGLGLAQVKAFGRQSGGDVRLSSEVGRGTTVCLVLPAGDPARVAASLPAAAAATPRADARPLHVLMVEDDPLVSAVVVSALENAGHRVSLFATADEAQRHLAEGAACDVLFTDVVMPGRLNGFDLVAWCRTARPTLPTVVATGYAAERAADDLVLLNKPYGIGDLMETLQRARRMMHGDETAGP